MGLKDCPAYKIRWSSGRVVSSRAHQDSICPQADSVWPLVISFIPQHLQILVSSSAQQGSCDLTVLSNLSEIRALMRVGARTWTVALTLEAHIFMLSSRAEFSQQMIWIRRQQTWVLLGLHISRALNPKRVRSAHP